MSFNKNLEQTIDNEIFTTQEMEQCPSKEIVELKTQLRNRKLYIKNIEKKLKKQEIIIEYFKNNFSIDQFNKISDMAYNEICRKEGVILQKDMKASRLINIIREKNTIINNIARRYSIPSSEIEMLNTYPAARKPCACIADQDTNWRFKN